MSAEAGVDNDKDGRGIGVGDFDNDGRLDFYQANADQPAVFYRNVTEGGGNWVQLKLTGTKSNRDAIGARITLTAGGLKQIQEIDGGNGYAGQSMKRVHFGLGRAAKIDSVEIQLAERTGGEGARRLDRTRSTRSPKERASSHDVARTLLSAAPRLVGALVPHRARGNPRARIPIRLDRPAGSHRTGAQSGQGVLREPHHAGRRRSTNSKRRWTCSPIPRANA